MTKQQTIDALIALSECGMFPRKLDASEVRALSAQSTATLDAKLIAERAYRLDSILSEYDDAVETQTASGTPVAEDRKLGLTRDDWGNASRMLDKSGPEWSRYLARTHYMVEWRNLQIARIMAV